MLSEDNDTSYDQNRQNSTNCDKTLIVKRTNLIFNDKECVVVDFQDISAFKRLKLEEEKTKLMSTLYSSVHHEMLGPLKTNEEAAIRLIRNLKD